MGKRTRIRYRQIIILALVFQQLISIAFAFPTSAKSISCHSQGATITKDYFIYTDWCSDNKKTTIYRCKRNGTSISNCKKIVKAVLGHANALNHVWGTNYFSVFDGWCNPKSNSDCMKGCYNLSGNKVSNSNCNVLPDNGKVRNYVKGTPQGYAQYGDYFIKGASSPNRIYIVQNRKAQKTLSSNLASGELEDVMVDGDTGAIYYTTSGNQTLNLHKYKGYTMPKLNSATASPQKTTTSTSVSAPSQSSSQSGQNNQTQTKSTTQPTQPSTAQPAQPAQPATSQPSTTPKSTTPQTDDTSSHGNADTFSDDYGVIHTVFFGDIIDNGKGCGVFTALNLVLDILSGAVGAVAIIGISVFGIQYLSAKGDEQQTAKAKRRINEIIIGIVAYVLIYAGLTFLLPGGKFSESSCTSSQSASQS